MKHKLNIEFSIYNITIMLIAIIAVLTLAGYSIFMHNSYRLTDTIFSGYISGFGSYLGGTFGGIIGALVAFGIAKIQLKADREKVSIEGKIKLLNILRALSIELKHNKRVLNIIKGDSDKKDDYIRQLEFDIWEKARFDACSYFDSEYYTILDEYYRECKDMKLNVLPEYKNVIVNLGVRIETIDKILIRIEEMSTVE